MDRIEEFYREWWGRPWHRYLLDPKEDGALGNDHHTVHIAPVMGHALVASKAHALVSAMASFSPPAVGQGGHTEPYKPWNTPMLTVDEGL